MADSYLNQLEIGHKDKLYNLSEAEQLLPVVEKITAPYHHRLLPIQQRLEKMLANDPRRKNLEADYELLVSRWRAKIEQLGVRVSGLWCVDFDVGEGWLSWRFPELRLAYFRAYGTHFSDRVKLIDVIEETDPDWAV